MELPLAPKKSRCLFIGAKDKERLLLYTLQDDELKVVEDVRDMGLNE